MQNPLIATLAALGCLLPAAVAQGDTTDPRAESELRRLDAPLLGSEPDEGAIRVQPTSHLLGGAPVSIGDAWKALYARDGVTFVPALGSQAPDTRRLHYRFESARVGQVPVVDLDLEVAPRLVGDEVRFERGAGLTEVYRATDAGLEQLFVLESLPARGADLVIEGVLSTDLARDLAATTASSLRFDEMGLASVVVERVLGIDARGHRVEGQMVLEDEHFELRLPASFVATAELPLVLDPVFGVELSASNSGALDEDEIDIAYGQKGASGKYLMVFSRYFASNDRDIIATRFNSSTSSLEQTYVIEADIGFIDTDPAVAFNAVEGTFPIVWRRQATSIADPVVHATHVAIDLPNVQPDLVLGGGRFPDVGASRHTGDRAICVYQSGSLIRTRRFTVDYNQPPTLGPSFTVMSLDAGAIGFADPSITRSDTDGGQFLIAVEQFFFPDRDLRMVAIDANGVSVSNDVLITSVGPDEQKPDVATDGESFMLVYEYEEVVGDGDGDIFARKLELTQTFFGFTLALEPEVIGVQTQSGIDTRAPAVAASRHEWVVVWEREFGTSGLYDTLLSTIGYDSCTTCEPEQFVSAPIGSNLEPEVAGHFDGGGSEDDTRAATAYWRSGSDGLKVRWRAWRSSPSSTSWVLNGNGCPGGGSIEIGGLLDLGGEVELRVEGLQPGFLAAMVNLAAPGNALVCTGCAIRNLGLTFTAVPFPSGTGASFTAPVPCNVALDGELLTFQYLIIGSQTSPCTGLPSVSASNTLNLTLGY